MNAQSNVSTMERTVFDMKKGKRKKRTVKSD